MDEFRFPQPGERTNTVAVPVPMHTLVALLTAALAWEIDTNTTFPGVVPPQIGDATTETLAQLSEEEARLVARIAEGLMQDRTDAELGV